VGSLGGAVLLGFNMRLVWLRAGYGHYFVTRGFWYEKITLQPAKGDLGLTVGN
jgi:hypothetical protein